MSDNKIKALIVEDDPSAIEALKIMLESHREIHVTGTARSGTEACALALKEKPELIFLDVEMPGRSGIEFLDLILREGLHPSVIFTTAFENYAIEAIRREACDYLVKPIDREELAMAITRFMHKRNMNKEAEDLRRLLGCLQPAQRIKFNSKKGFVMIDPQEIIFCEADWNYTSICHGDGRKELSTLNLGKIEALLPADQFLRINRSMLFNIRYLVSVDKKNRTCLLKKGDLEYPFKLSILNLRRLEREMRG